MPNVISIISSQKKQHAADTHLGLSQTNQVIDLDGNISTKPLTYLDSTATALAQWPIQEELKAFLKDGYANTHTTGHHRGRDSTEAVNAARDSVGKFVGYNKEHDMVIFNGYGATGPLNYLAQVLFPKSLQSFIDPDVHKKTKHALLKTLTPEKKRIAKEMMEKPIVITTEMEHHANQLPWFDNKNVKFVPVNSKTGELDMDVLKELLEKHKGKVRVVSVSGASNITGIMNPIYDIAKMAHEAGAEICVDSAQLAPHHKIEKRRKDPRENIDYLVMSPHKFGVPNTPGVLVANQSLLDGRRNLVTVGGGMVNTVSINPVEFTPIDELDAGEEPGTPNIGGIVSIGLAAANLTRNMPKLEAHEKELTHYLMEKLQKIGDGDVEIIGSTDPDKRVGVVSFIVKGVHHPIVTAFLNDHWNIAVRNGCFCAHPLITKMSGISDSEMDKIRKGDRSDMPGYIRASFGEHNTHRDVDTLVQALTELVNNKDKVLSNYTVDTHGNAIRKDGFRQPKGWSFDEAVDRAVVTEKMQKLGFNPKEISFLLPVFNGNNLLSLITPHDNCKAIIKKVSDTVCSSDFIDEKNKLNACKEVLQDIYQPDKLEKGAHSARVNNRPIYKSESGQLHVTNNWENAIKTMVTCKFAAKTASVATA